MEDSGVDPLVEEIRKDREEYAAKFDFDLDRIFLDLKRLEQEDDGPYVSFAPQDPYRNQSSN